MKPDYFVDQIRFAAITLVLLTLGCAPALGDGSSLRGPIEVVIHSKYGGGTETTARMMMAGAEKRLGVDMVMISRRGGSGAAAMNYVLGRPADGRTLLAVTQSHLYTMARGKSDMNIGDLRGVARSMDDPTLIVVRASSEYPSFDALIEASRNKRILWGISQVGGTEHVGLMRLSKAVQIEAKVVPFGSGAAMVQGLLSGAVDAILPNVSEARGAIDNGSVRPLLVMAAERLASYPELPTTYEHDLPVKTSTTRGYAVLASTPEHVVRQLSEALVEAMSQGMFPDYLASAGLSVTTSVADWTVWDEQLREEYRKAEAILGELGLDQP